MAHDYALTVRAEVARRRGQPAEALALLERARPQQWWNPLVVASPFYGQSYERWMRAELSTALGKEATALDWYAGLGFWGPGTESTLMPPARIRMGEITEGLGQRDEAIAHYTRALERWKDCDPKFRPMLDDIRRRLARLRAAGSPGE